MRNTLQTDDNKSDASVVVLGSHQEVTDILASSVARLMFMQWLVLVSLSTSVYPKDSSSKLVIGFRSDLIYEICINTSRENFV